MSHAGTKGNVWLICSMEIRTATGEQVKFFGNISDEIFILFAISGFSDRRTGNINSAEDAACGKAESVLPFFCLKTG